MTWPHNVPHKQHACHGRFQSVMTVEPLTVSLDSRISQLFVHPPSSAMGFVILLIASGVPLFDTLGVAWEAVRDQLEMRLPTCYKALIAPVCAKIDELGAYASQAVGTLLDPLMGGIDSTVKDVVDHTMQSKAALLGLGSSSKAGTARGRVLAGQEAQHIQYAADASTGLDSTHVIDEILRSIRTSRLVTSISERVRGPFLEYGLMIRGSPLKCVRPVGNCKARRLQSAARHLRSSKGPCNSLWVTHIPRHP